MSDNDNSNIAWAQSLSSMLIKSCELQVGGVTMDSWYYCTTCKKQIDIDLKPIPEDKQGPRWLLQPKRRQGKNKIPPTLVVDCELWKGGEDKASVERRDYNCPGCYRKNTNKEKATLVPLPFRFEREQ